ncbi:GNAT family N-acetyltransferase [Virgibacillus ainsalahensis]
MNWNKVEIEKEIVAFIKSWGYCRKTPNTEINTTGDVKKVKFGEKVYGRELEFFHFYQSDPLPNEFKHLNKPHWVTLFSHTQEVNKKMEGLGYDSQASEYLMKLSAKTEFMQYNKYQVKEVKTEKQAEKINDVLSFQKYNPNRIYDPYIRYYFIEIDHKPVCTGIMSINEGVSCLDRVHTDENYRGFGLAANLCSFMLDMSKSYGVTKNILGSSEMGFHLYKKLGYETVIPMYVFSKE